MSQMCLMSQVCLSEPKLSSKGSQEMTMSQKRSMGRHLVSHMLRGQNGGFTVILTRFLKDLCLQFFKMIDIMCFKGKS